MEFMETLLQWLKCCRYKFCWLHYLWGTLYGLSFCFLFFSAKVSPNVSWEQASEILELDDISEEEAETAHAKSSLKVVKLKVPRK